MDTPKDYVSIHYEVDIGFQHLLLSKDELKKIVESEEECKKIRVVSKAYTFPDRSSRWIVLFGDDSPLKDPDGKLYYWTFSDETYGTEIMDDFDKMMIQRWLDIRVPLLNQKKK
jgi:hypothetical protein